MFADKHRYVPTAMSKCDDVSDKKNSFFRHVEFAQFVKRSHIFVLAKLQRAGQQYKHQIRIQRLMTRSSL